MARSMVSASSTPFLSMLLVVLSLLPGTAVAAYVNFQNCLDANILHSHPQLLQFVPLNVSATFNSSNPKYPLNVTVYGNVTGLNTQQSYPAPDDPQWSNMNDTVGKIVNESTQDNKLSTLFAKLNVLTFQPYNAPAAIFCNSLVQGDCPLGPAFSANQTELALLPAFSIEHQLQSSYAFTTISANLQVISGDSNKAQLACVTATITPDLGGTLRAVLRYLPAVILIIVGAATIFAAMFSPWGTTDGFRWTSNYGRDEDLLRLVTPGFGDCLQYIQFIVLSGSLSLNYPGYYQPVVSRVGWSALMFNESLVSGGNGMSNLVDGIYSVNSNGTYGLDQMSQYIGMESVRDIWVGMIVWLLVIVAAIVVLIEIGFFSRWLYRHLANIPAEDLRSKNWPFTAGSIIRIVFNYFLLPLVSLSMYQFLIATKGPNYATALAAIVLVGIIAFSAYVLYFISKTRPRSFLFDDLPTVLLWGPLYNTFCDDQAGFGFFPLLLNFMRGLAIGAVQPSGIAQLVILAICEIVLALTLNAIRPYPSATSMNAYHTFFAMVRLFTILLSVAFVPSLGTDESASGWIGYAILLLHACALVFGFFLNAMQTIIEVAARLAGAGGRNNATGPTRGGLTRVFGMRQLSKRVPRHDTASRHSMASGAAMLSPDMDTKSVQLEAGRERTRSLSASSTLLLNQQSVNNRSSQGFETASPGPYDGGSPSTFDNASSSSKPLQNSRFSNGSMSPGGIIGFKQAGQDPYFRKPRRSTAEMVSPVAQKHGSLVSQQSKRESDIRRSGQDSNLDAGEGPSVSGRNTPVPAHIATTNNDEFEDVTNDLKRTKTDYAVREVDYYYGVRGPALSSGTRKLKTGPADPTGPVSSATGWFKNIFGGKTKEKGKGFEVVRSSRAPPPGLMTPSERPSTVQEQYKDDEEEDAEAADIAQQQPYHDEELEEDRGVSPLPEGAELEGVDGRISQFSGAYEPEDNRASQVSPIPPVLPQLDTGGDIKMPSRIGSQTSRKAGPPPATETAPPVPAVPQRSTKRTYSNELGDPTAVRMSDLSSSPRDSSPNVDSRSMSPRNRESKQSNLSAGGRKRDSYWPVHRLSSSNVPKIQPSPSGRIPFSEAQNTAPKDNRLSTGANSTVSSAYPNEAENQTPVVTQNDGHSSSALGVHAPDLRDDRPSSMGFVQQHRASDHIHQSPESPEHAGSSAEFIGEQGGGPSASGIGGIPTTSTAYLR